MLGSLIMLAAMTGQAPAARADRPKPPANATQKLIEKRRAKKTGRYVARLNRETAEAIAEQKAYEAAKKEYREMLPYMLEVRRQDLARDAARDAADAERAKAAAIARAAGYASGTYQRPTIVNQGGIYAP